MEVMLRLFMIVSYALLMFGFSKFVKWGIHEAGPLKFGLFAFPLLFLCAYLVNRWCGRGEPFW
jgi:hypothetical protein